MRKLLHFMLLSLGLVLVASNVYAHAHTLKMEVFNTSGKDLNIVGLGSKSVGNNWSDGADVPLNKRDLTNRSFFGATLHTLKKDDADSLDMYVRIADPNNPDKNYCYLEILRARESIIVNFSRRWSKVDIVKPATKCYGNLKIASKLRANKRTYYFNVGSNN